MTERTMTTSPRSLPPLRASFTFAQVSAGVVYIVDQALKDDTTSITNDAEAVVTHILARFPAHRIVYCDTDHRWDELKHDGRDFIGFAPWTGRVPSWPMPPF